MTTINTSATFTAEDPDSGFTLGELAKQLNELLEVHGMDESSLITAKLKLGRIGNNGSYIYGITATNYTPPKTPRAPRPQHG